MLRHSHNAPDPATVHPFPSALPSLTDWLVLCLPAERAMAVNDALASRYAAAARRRLQRRAADHLRRDACGALASLIVAGDWAALDRLCDTLEAS